MESTNRPEWLKKRINLDNNYQKTESVLKDLNLNTVCQAAFCPNLGECFRAGVATFMILGNVCTRNCRFCDIPNGQPEEIDQNEPENLAKAARKMNLDHVVITSVTRDDLKDGGSGHFVKIIKEFKNIEGITIEVLTPDFNGKKEDIKNVLKAGPDVFNHNIETVPRLYSKIRPEADYQQSLTVLNMAKQFDGSIITKSGLMLGLGEQKSEVISVMEDLRKNDCDLLTIGQYLQPSSEHAELKKYIEPSKFREYKRIALNLGFKAVASQPFVRSSYQAKELYLKAIKQS
jgi:lipoic acid synthetase